MGLLIAPAAPAETCSYSGPPNWEKDTDIHRVSQPETLFKHYYSGIVYKAQMPGM